jgi:shikimate kinase
MNITLTGFMGTGKTSTGRRLAKRLGWRFVDVDELIEAAARMPIPRIFRERGEAVFRRLERRAISRVARDSHQVIATGGGAFADPQNRARLRSCGPVVALTAKPQTILARVGPKLQSRPLLAGRKPLARIQALMRRRAKAYAQADLTLDTTKLSVEETVERLWERLSPCVGKSWQYVLTHCGQLTQRYGGRYIVVADDRIVGSGDTQFEAFHSTPSRLIDKREAGIYYIPLPEESLTAL